MPDQTMQDTAATSPQQSGGITLADYSDPLMALQLAKLDQQETGWIDRQLASDIPLTAQSRGEIARQYAFRARLNTDLAGLATNPDTAAEHRRQAEVCRGARQLYLDSIRVEGALAALSATAPTGKDDDGEWVEIVDLAAGAGRTA